MAPVIVLTVEKPFHPAQEVLAFDDSGDLWNCKDLLAIFPLGTIFTVDDVLAAEITDEPEVEDEADQDYLEICSIALRLLFVVGHADFVGIFDNMGRIQVVHRCHLHRVQLVE